ncbi:hypothetical protein G6F56_000515 [Rhizopus delemar]|nr:hypothetical protein G6F56_000515 [Rhizopus delemar]
MNDNSKRTNNRLNQAEKDILEGFIASLVSHDTADYKELLDLFFKKTTLGDFENKGLMPQEGYVCKTKVLRASPGYPNQMPVYINLCFNCNITPPPITSDADYRKALRHEPSVFNIPFSMGQPFIKDKKEVVINAMVQTQVFSRSLRDLEFKHYMLNSAIAYTERIMKATLSRDFEIPPYMNVRGELGPIYMRLPKEEIVYELMDMVDARKNWTLQPHLVKKADEIFVLIDMPNQDYPRWETRLAEDGLELMVNTKKYFVPLKYSIDRDNEENKIDFYKQDKTLVCQFKLLERKQYL